MRSLRKLKRNFSATHERLMTLVQEAHPESSEEEICIIRAAFSDAMDAISEYRDTLNQCITKAPSDQQLQTDLAEANTLMEEMKTKYAEHVKSLKLPEDDLAPLLSSTEQVPPIIPARNGERSRTPSIQTRSSVRSRRKREAEAKLKEIALQRELEEKQEQRRLQEEAEEEERRKQELHEEEERRKRLEAEEDDRRRRQEAEEEERRKQRIHAEEERIKQQRQQEKQRREEARRKQEEKDAREMQRRLAELQLRKEMEEDSQDISSEYDSDRSAQTSTSQKSRRRKKKKESSRSIVDLNQRRKSIDKSINPPPPEADIIHTVSNIRVTHKENRVPDYNHDFTTKVRDSGKSPSGHSSQSCCHSSTPDYMNKFLHMQVMERREDKFNGDSKKYLSFRNEFALLMDKFPDDPHYLFNELLATVTGEAAASISHCKDLLNDPEHALHTALSVLKRDFGSEYQIRKAHLKHITECHKKVTWDAASLRKLLADLEKCSALLKGSSHHVYLDSPETINGVLERLPDFSHKGFVRACNKLEDPTNPGFDFLVKFIESELKQVNSPFVDRFVKGSNGRPKKDDKNPRFSRASTISGFDKPDNSKKKFPGNRKGQEKHANGPKQGNSSSKGSQDNRPQYTCQCCGDTKLHRLKECSKFLNASVEERWKYVKKNADRCPACFGLHKLKECKSKYSCQNCGYRDHNTLLCRKPPQQQGHASSVRSTDDAAGESSSETTPKAHVTSASPSSFYKPPVYVRVVPILAYTPTGNSAEIYALLDSGSDTTLATRDLAHKLNLKGRQFNLRLEGVTNVKDMHAMEVSFSIKGLHVNNPEVFNLTHVTCVSSLPSHSRSIPSSSITARHAHLQDLEFPLLPRDCIDIIIGSDHESLHRVIESRYSSNSSLCAHLTPLGWVLAGPDNMAQTSTCQVATSSAVYDLPSYCPITPDHHDEISDFTLKAVQDMMHNSVEHPTDEDPAKSIEDEKVLELFESEKSRTEDGHMMLPIPFYDKDVVIPNNRSMAESRLRSLRKSLLKDPNRADFYCKKMRDTINKGYLNKVDHSVKPKYSQRICYIPHFDTKQEKNRIVFDAAATHLGRSFNSYIMQGPDLMQPLVDVLTRFREDSIAFTCDIKEMFHQVKIPPDERSARVLWFKDDDFENGEIEDLEVAVHAFGWRSSPSAANFTVRDTAMENRSNADPETQQVMISQTYMDDCLGSEPTVPVAIHRAKQLNELGASSGFAFVKYTSNSREFLQALDPELLAPEVKEIDLLNEEVPTHKALGVYWDPSTDELVVKVNIIQKPATRRGMLSMLHKTFDPLGIVLPYIVQGRRIMQDAFTQSGTLDWDAELPSDLNKRWKKWVKQLQCLDGIRIPRCYHGSGARPTKYELHTFADSSDAGLGMVSYLRYFKDDKWSCSYVRGKARLIRKGVQWPVARHELDAAVLGVGLHQTIIKALSMDMDKTVLWSDSATVLSWIKNTERRPKVFVYNRRKDILRLSAPTQWKYVHTTVNPADLITRGIPPKKASADSLWIKGPDFLFLPDEEWPVWKVPQVNIHDLELVPQSVVCALHGVTEEPRKTPPKAVLSPQDKVFQLLWKYSDLSKLQKVLAWLRRLSTKNTDPTLSVAELDSALLEAIRLSQLQYYSPAVIKRIQEKGFKFALDNCQNKELKVILKGLANLAPFIDDSGLLRVGGRLQNSTLPADQIHPIILPKRHHVTSLLIENVHCKNKHFGGVSFTLNCLRSQYWVTSSTVKFYLNKCLACIRIRAKTGTQMMAPLPADRAPTSGHPFQATGVDYFGPVLVKVKRSQVKRWVALFTCLATRAVHLEVVFSLHTSSFLQAFIRFKCSRGNVTKTLYSDNATTFHGADAELKRALERLEEEGFARDLRSHGVDWNFNAPLASHQGGIWERLIRSVRKVLLGVPALQNSTPTDESLLTYLKEAESIINHRPLTSTSSGDPEDLPAITPAMILIGVLAPSTPMDVFHSADQLRSDWRYTQIAAEQFWSRFVKEYLSNLQPRAKWYDSCANFKVGDVVLVKEIRFNHRPNYPKARVIGLHPGRDGLVRNVDLKFADGKTLTRDIRKVVPLEGAVQ